MWFGGETEEVPFTTFGGDHVAMIVVFLIGTILIYMTRQIFSGSRQLEIFIAFSLIVFELGYHAWALINGEWHISYSLPLELSNFSVILVIVLLLTHNQKLFHIVFLIAIGGALQAIATPVLGYGFPHFRYWHFFYTHIVVIWVAFYYLWHRSFSLPFISVIKAMIFLNIFLPIIYMVNLITGGNYWFIMQKPPGESLLDFLGPEPWYILGMQGAAFVFFLLLWAIFGTRKWKDT